ncbi:MAG: M48 family metalloprotease [Bacteroidota bacterium]
MNKFLSIGLSAILLLLFNSCVKNPVTGQRDFMLMSKEQEIAMGQQSDPDIVNQFGLYEDKKLQQFIQDKGQQMAAISHRPDIKYEFKIVDSPVVNAFAVPGGYVYFTRGIMAYFNNEAQFAGVLGHETGHITARHSAKQYSKSVIAQLGLVVGMVVSPQLAQYGELAQEGVGLLFLKFGRDAERQADELGVEYSTKIGYNAQYMGDFFNTLDRMGKQSDAESVPTFLSTHPDPANRFETVHKLAAEWQKKLNLTTADLKVNRNAYLKLIDGIVYGEDPKQGFVEANTFYHPVMKFQHPVPKGWLVQNSPQQLQMSPTNGKALMVLSLAPVKSLAEAAQQVVEKNQLKVVESKNLLVNGLTAVAIVADQQQQSPPQPSQQQTQAQPAVRALIYLIEYGGNIYNLMGISAATDFSTYYPTFNSTMNNFRELTDQAKINKKPDRIRIKTVRKQGTLAEAFKDYKVKEDKMKELAILNGMELKDKVSPGLLIKVFEK